MKPARSSFAKFAPLAALCLFGAAIWFVHRELRDVHYHELAASLKAIPFRNILLSAFCALVSYVALTGYDALGLKYAGCKLEYSKTALTSFISFVISNNFGFSAFTGGLVRFRLYSIFGIGASDTVKVAGFCAVTFWQGVFFLGGLALLWDPLALPPLPVFRHFSPMAVGVLLLAGFAAYFLAAMFLRGPIRIRGVEIVAPRPGLVLGQVCVSTLDWIAAGAALYFLLPSQLHAGLTGFLAIFIVSQTIGLLSNVPGGAGIFEASMLLLLPGQTPRTELFAALVAYRAVYYLGPLCIATLLFGGFELLQKRNAIRKGYGWIRMIANPVIPLLSGAVVFFSGCLLLLSGTTRALPDRMEWLNAFLPLGILEASHFLAGLAGISLLLLARGLQLRLYAAFHIAVWVLGAGSLLSILKGFDFEEAILLAAALLFLLPCRGHFTRRSALRDQTLTPGWNLSIAFVLVTVIWLGLFSYKHVEFRNDLLWNFALDGNSSRFLRSSVGIAVFLALFTGWRLLRPAKAQSAETATTPQDLDLIQPIVREFPKSYAHLALLGDKSLLFNGKKNAFIMYRGEGRSLISMGDPVGPDAEIPELIWEFKSLADQHFASPVFYQVTAAQLPRYIDIGLSFQKLGEEALIPLESFSLENKEFKGMRGNSRKLEKEGVEFRILPPEAIAGSLDEIRAVSDSWMSSKNAKEKGFSLGYFDAEYLKRCPIAVALKEQRIVAFSNLWIGGAGDEISSDLMRYSADAPKGIMDYLFAGILAHGKAQGFRCFNLGMAPLSGIENRPLAPMWSKAGAFLFRHGEHFYNFQGLRQYKAKFHPVWEPRYLASPGGLALPRVLTNLTTLISGGLKGIVSK
jgi:phosphatidylglycerol lysyltransferase